MRTVLSCVFPWDSLLCGHYLGVCFHGTPFYADSTFCVFPWDPLLCGQYLVVCFHGTPCYADSA